MGTIRTVGSTSKIFWIFQTFPKPVSGKPYTRLECLYEGGREGGEVPEDKVMPIPLTPEILEKNGINLDMNVDLTKPLFSMGIHANDTCVKKRFRYIHELQHALRLCGLEELADNFKIK